MKTERKRKWSALFSVVGKPGDADFKIAQVSKWRTDKNRLLRAAKQLQRNQPGINLLIRSQEFHEKHVHPIDKELLAESKKLVRFHRVASPEKVAELMNDPEYAKGLLAAQEIVDRDAEEWPDFTEKNDASPDSAVVAEVESKLYDESAPSVDYAEVK